MADSFVRPTCLYDMSTWLTIAHVLSLMEGLPTVLVGFLVLFFLPSRPETTKWLSEDDRKLAQRRLNREVASEGTAINWKHVIMSFTDYKAWMVSICIIWIFRTATDRIFRSA